MRIRTKTITLPKKGQEFIPVVRKGMGSRMLGSCLTPDYPNGAGRIVLQKDGKRFTCKSVGHYNVHAEEFFEGRWLYWCFTSSNFRFIIEK